MIKVKFSIQNFNLNDIVDSIQVFKKRAILLAILLICRFGNCDLWMQNGSIEVDSKLASGSNLKACNFKSFKIVFFNVLSLLLDGIEAIYFISVDSFELI